MKQPLAPKIFGGTILFIFATVFFIMSPILVGLFLVIPLFLLSLRVIAKTNVQFTDYSQKHSYSSNTEHRRSYHASPVFRHSNLMGTSSLSDRIRTFGR